MAVAGLHRIYKVEIYAMADSICQPLAFGITLIYCMLFTFISPGQPAFRQQRDLPPNSFK